MRSAKRKKRSDSGGRDLRRAKAIEQDTFKTAQTLSGARTTPEKIQSRTHSPRRLGNNGLSSAAIGLMVINASVSHPMGVNKIGEALRPKDSSMRSSVPPQTHP